MWMHVNDQTAPLISENLSKLGHVSDNVLVALSRISVKHSDGLSGANIPFGAWVSFHDNPWDGLGYEVSLEVPTEVYDLQLERCKTLAEVIQTGVGAASMCWENVRGAGTFDSTRAKDVSDQIYNAAQKFLCPEHPEEKTDYTVEIAGQTFTKEQWEAVRLYIEGTRATVVDGATVLPS